MKKLGGGKEQHAVAEGKKAGNAWKHVQASESGLGGGIQCIAAVGGKNGVFVFPMVRYLFC